MLERFPVTAMFDTGCQGANWVSNELVTEWGMEKKIQGSQSNSSCEDANGQPVHCMGTIELRWQHHDEQDIHKYKKVHRGDFNVWSSKHIQIIFGAPYCRENNLVHFNVDALTPLIPKEKMSSSMSIS